MLPLISQTSNLWLISSSLYSDKICNLQHPILDMNVHYYDMLYLYSLKIPWPLNWQLISHTDQMCKYLVVLSPQKQGSYGCYDSSNLEPPLILTCSWTWWLPTYSLIPFCPNSKKSVWCDTQLDKSPSDKVPRVQLSHWTWGTLHEAGFDKAPSNTVSVARLHDLNRVALHETGLNNAPSNIVSEVRLSDLEGQCL